MMRIGTLDAAARAGEAALAKTIAAYDSEAKDYAVRFERVDLSRYMEAFVELLPSPDGGVLDLGCGSGRDLRELGRRGIAATGIDLSWGMLEAAEEMAPQAEVLLGDMRALPFEQHIFSGVWSCASLVHLSFEGALTALTDAHRVLRPGGGIFVSVVAGVGDEWRVTDSGAMKWFQRYSEEEVSDLMTLAGFEVARVETERGVSHGTWVNALGMRG